MNTYALVCGICIPVYTAIVTYYVRTRLILLALVPVILLVGETTPLPCIVSNAAVYVSVVGWMSYLWAMQLREYVTEYLTRVVAPQNRARLWGRPLSVIGLVERRRLSQDVFETLKFLLWKSIYDTDIPTLRRMQSPWFLEACISPLLCIWIPVCVPKHILYTTCLVGVGCIVIQWIRLVYWSRRLSTLMIRTLISLAFAFVFGWIDPGQATQLRVFPYFIAFILLWIVSIVSRELPETYYTPTPITPMEGTDIPVEESHAFEQYLMDLHKVELWYFVLDVKRFMDESPNHSYEWNRSMLNGLIVSYILTHSPMYLNISESNRSSILSYAVTYGELDSDEVLDRVLNLFMNMTRGIYLDTLCKDWQRLHSSLTHENHVVV